MSTRPVVRAQAADTPQVNLAAPRYSPPPVAIDNPEITYERTRPRRGRLAWLALALVVGLGALLLLILSSVTLAAPDAPGPWTTVAMTIPRSAHSATLLTDGRVLVAGGWDGTTTVAAADLFDPQTGIWTPAAMLQDARAYPAAALLPTGRVLVAGGWDNVGQALTSTEIYDPASNTWTPATPLALGRAGAPVVPLRDGRLLLVGGCGAGTAVVADATAYDPATGAWQAAGQLRQGRCWTTATVLADGRVLVVGGRDAADQVLASAEVYDPARNAWQAAGILRTPRREHTATLLPDGRVLVAGGFDGRDYLASAEVYDPTTNAWTATGSLAAPRANHAALLMRNGQVLAAGGATAGRPSQETEAYHPQSGQWTPSGPLPARYAALLLTLLADDRILVSGQPDLDEAPVRLTTPEPARTPGPRGPTPTPQGMTMPNTAASDRGADNMGSETLAGVQVVPPSTSNYATGTQTARLFGVYETSFTRPQPTSTGYNPYAETLTVAFDPPYSGASGNLTVRAFYDGTTAGQETWRARVYVDRAGTWGWQSSTGTPGSFEAEEALDSGLHGMLRVSALATPSATALGSPKRWYTDDGRTFLPMADTAYLLFFEAPPGGVPGSKCPPTRSTPDAQATVLAYADAVASRGVNVLRTEALGTWAYEGISMPTPTAVLVECATDLSLFWSTDREGSNTDLFNVAPTIAQLMTPTASFYPNLKSFQNTDQKLRWLLESNPGLYIQMILVPEPGDTGADHTWNASPPAPSIAPGFRKQLWRTMVARWAAFPNVFWSVSNDLSDTQPNNRALLDELGCYFGGAATSCDGETVLNPWRNHRPVSGGHLRGARDTFATDPSAPWHTYITAYSDADISAQQMDGARTLPEIFPAVGADVRYAYASANKPVFNTEDRYEGTDEIQTNPAYFYRRLFWAYLLSSSGATYGAQTTWRGNAIYTTPALQGLEGVKYLPAILAQAHSDMNLFTPKDRVIPTPPTTTVEANNQWYEYDRAQVAVRDTQEILAYLPNGGGMTQPGPTVRRNAAPATGTLGQIKVRLAENNFNDAAYQLTWYDPKNGAAVYSTVIPRVQPTTTANSTPIPVNNTLFATPPAGFTGDAILHLSSRCVGNNKCEPMDEPIPVHTPSNSEWVFNSSAGFQAGDDESAVLDEDAVTRVFGASSWRCDRPTAPGSGFPGCWVRYDFPGGRTVASAAFYYRRNSVSAYQGLYFITTPSQASSDPILDGNSATSIDIWFGPAGDLHLGISNSSGPSSFTEMVRQNVTPDINRWYHVFAKVERASSGTYRIHVYVDGALQFDVPSASFAGNSDRFFRRTVVHSAWWGETWDLPVSDRPSVWWDELSIDPPPGLEQQGLYHTYLQQDLGGYDGARATYFDGAAGYDGSSFLRIGANNYDKALLRFNVSELPPDAVIDEATLALYYAGRSNANSLTLGAHGVLAAWTDSVANRTQRQAGINWNVPGLGAGSDYSTTPTATLAVVGEGNAWVELDVTGLAQTWVSDPSQNHGLLLQQAAASGFVVYSFCSEVAQAPATPTPPCLAGHAPKLILRYHLVGPTPVKTTFQRGAGGYTGNVATYFDGSGSGYNSSNYLRVSADNYTKSLLRFDVGSIPITETVAEAVLRVYPQTRSNANGLTVAAHRVLADWNDSAANRAQRQNEVNWQVVGMGTGADYAVDADGAVELTSAGVGWVEVVVTDMVQAWVAEPTTNHGLVLLAQAASGSVNYGLCSELGWSPCTLAQAPVLKIWHYPPPPTPEPEP